MFDDFLQDREDAQATGGTPAAQQVSGGTVGASSSTGSATGQATAAAPPSAPSGFVPMQKYYDANSGSAQSTAASLARPVQDNVTKAQAGIAKLGTDFGTAVDAGTPAGLKGPVQKLAPVPTFDPSTATRPSASGGSNAPGAPKQTTPGTQGHKGYTYDGGYDPTTPATSTPTTAAPAATPGTATQAPPRAASGSWSPYSSWLDPSASSGPATVTAGPAPVGRGTHAGDPGTVDTATATALGNMTYTGPASVAELAGYAPTSQAVGDAAQGLYALGTQGGRQTLLQNQYGGNNYGLGSAGFDSALTGMATNNYADLRRQSGDLPGALSGLVTSSAATAAGVKKDDQTKADIYKTEGQAGTTASDAYAKAYQDWLGQHANGAGKQNVGGPNGDDIMVQDANGRWSWQPAPPGYWSSDPAQDWMETADEGIQTAIAGAVNPAVGAAYGAVLKGTGDRHG